MRRVLILGGTGWLGREIARVAHQAGDEVVCLARGESGAVPDGVRLIRADRSRPGAYDAATGRWDEVVELSHEPALVASALAALADRAAHWTLVSTISVYADAGVVGADETAELVEPVDLTAYPEAKVHAERLSAARLGDRLLLARPGLIVGPGDPSDRFGYWPARLHRGGRVLVPAAEDRWVQVIDVADLAAWLVEAGRRRIHGAVDAIGPSRPLAEVLTAAQRATGHTGELVAVDDATLLAHGVHHWAGPRSLPLWLPPEAGGLARRRDARFRELGGTARPLAETLDRVLSDEVARGVDRERRSGLTPEEEQEVLRALG